MLTFPLKRGPCTGLAYREDCQPQSHLRTMFKLEGNLPDQDEKSGDIWKWTVDPKRQIRFCVPVTLITAYTLLMNQMYFTILCRVKTNPVVKFMINYLYPVLLGYSERFLYSKALRNFILRRKKLYLCSDSTIDIITSEIPSPD